MLLRTIVAALLGALLVSSCGSAAAEDITLRYASPDSPGDSLVIEADSEGRIRAEDGRGQMIFVLDGETYIVFENRGRRVVAKLRDHLQAGSELRQRLLASGALSAGGAEDSFRLVEHGPQRVGQWEGARYSVEPELSGPSLEAVVSTDPALARARAVAAPVFQAREAVGGAVLVIPARYGQLVRGLLDRGMPLKVDRLQLQSISEQPLPAGRFELPAPPMPIGDLRQLMRETG